MTKGKRKAKERRRIRKLEKKFEGTRSLMMGAVTKRGWGKGIA